MVYLITKVRWPPFFRKVQSERTHEIFQYLTQIKDKTILIESQLKFFTKDAFNFLFCAGAEMVYLEELLFRVLSFQQYENQ